MQTFDSFLMSMISSGTPILFALMGDLVGQQTGIISLSVEGSMLMGACAGFAVAAYTNNLILGCSIGRGIHRIDSGISCYFEKSQYAGKRIDTYLFCTRNNRLCRKKSFDKRNRWI